MKRQIDTIISKKATEWIGVKFLYRGFTKEGCDCVGFLVGLLLECGIDRKHLECYFSHREGCARYIDANKIIDTLETLSTLYKVKTKNFLSVVTFSMNKTTKVNHIALELTKKIYTKDVRFIIHSHRSAGAVVENILDSYWEDRLLHRYYCYF